MIFQSVKMAFKSIASNKMRSFLTMLGIIIGVMALVVLVSLVSDTTSSVTEQISDLGNNLMTVMITDDKGNPMKISDVQALADEEEIGAACPSATSSVTASSSYSEEDATITGTTGSYSDIMGLDLYSGRFLKNVDITNHSYVVVINAGMAVDVMGRMNVVGETISLNGVDFQIVGVLAADDNDDSTTESYEAYIPYTTLVRLVDTVSTDITNFYVTAASDDQSDAAETKLESILMERFADDEDAFTIMNQSVIAEAMETVTNMLALMLGGIAGISLLVGGIGIMNIMLVSVTERTREIGIRKAIGATQGVILLQFLIEALALSMMGCLIGIVLSWVILRIVSIFASEYDLSYSLSMGVVWVAVAFSMAIGVIFGLYPAWKAAKKKPIDALRYTG